MSSGAECACPVGPIHAKPAPKGLHEIELTWNERAGRTLLAVSAHHASPLLSLIGTLNWSPSPKVEGPPFDVKFH